MNMCILNTLLHKFHILYMLFAYRPFVKKLYPNVGDMKQISEVEEKPVASPLNICPESCIRKELEVAV
jgi:hypothetical protein